ncbi:dTDP-glucose 4,6-dehydratase [Neolewinella sp.]|uniref:dTDP-glucose 4,6-dehydratase n=1 Tax=Neolewinella sp. TaxID=2993543 RepID=UPI003B52CCE9
MTNRTVLVTGGAGFIGSHLVRYLVTKYPHYLVLNLDLLTYAGNLANLVDVADRDNYRFVRADIRDAEALRQVFADFPIDTVVHLAAESHVDRSIEEPLTFVQTNLIGTAQLLQVAREVWHRNFTGKLFYHVSTDEVYGSLDATGLFTETTSYAPRSPYAASKAGSDHLVRAWHHTYGMPVVLSNCSNNYGPNQFPEKLIPLCINNILHQQPLPVYGQGINVRDWLYVEDHVRAIDLILHRGRRGQTYNIGGHNEWRNIDLVCLLCQTMDRKLGRAPGSSERLITYVTDRAGHDLRYAIDATKLERELGWVPDVRFEEGIVRTVNWYLSNEAWVAGVTSGAYRDYYAAMYAHR